MRNFRILLIISLFLLTSNYSQSRFDACRMGLSVFIPDNSTVYDSIYFPNYLTHITEINVRIDTVVHTWDDDLIFYLKKGSSIVKLINRVGGSGDNFINTIIDDSASMPINQGTPPFSGRYRLENYDSLLSVFRNVNPTGYWRLAITDTATGDIGYLKAWCLQISGFVIDGLKVISNEVPLNYGMSQNYPNPFNPSTKIRFAVKSNVKRETSNAKLIIFDVLGQEVKTLINEDLQPGTYETEFNGEALTSGVYYYRLIIRQAGSSTGDFVQTRKMILIK